jgi:amidohydrolase
MCHYIPYYQPKGSLKNKKEYGCMADKSRWTDLIARVQDVTDRTIALRRDLHRIPEASGQELKTSARVLQELGELDVAVQSEVAGTGVVVDLDTERPDPLIVLRADMDALPMEDRSAESYRSLHPGLAHTCGHDGHTAILIGVVHVLSHLREGLTGRIRFVFQPAEETASGAQAMLAAGVLGQDPPEAILALHACPGIATDTVTCRAGVIAASNDAFTITVQGQGGHSARPHQARNPLDGMARLLQGLPALSTQQRVITICTAHAGNSKNVIPETGILAGTARCLDEVLRQRSKTDIEEQAQALCAPLDLHASVVFQEGCPSVQNDARLFSRFQDMGQALHPLLHVEEAEGPSMGGEDFAFFTQQAPGLLLRLGVGIHSPLLHTPEFSFNDDAIPTGMLAFAGLVLQLSTERNAH